MQFSGLLKCLVFLALFWVAQAHALVLHNQPSAINPVASTQFLADPSGKLTFEEVSSAAYASKFKTAAPHGEDINFGFTRDTYWIKLSLSRAAHSEQKWILSIPYQTLDRIAFYAPGKPPVITGNLQSFDSRPIKSRFFAFPLSVETNTQDFYLQVNSQYSLTVPMELWLPEDYFESTGDASILQALYFGELLSLVIYNLLLFLYLRDKSFFIYALFGVAMGMAMFAGNGYGRIYLWQNLPHWDEVAQCTCLSLASLFGIWFTNSFLNSKKNAPKLYKILAWMSYCYVAISIALPLGHLIDLPINYLFVTFAIISPITTLLFVATGVIALRAGQREARFFLLAWGVLWTGGFIAAMRSFGIVPSNPLTNYAVQISSAFEMLLLSFALADRIRIERMAREHAQIEKIAAEKQLVRALINSEQKLENTVALRTAELETSLTNEKNLRELYVRFGAFISHEFRNPLNLIESQVALFRRERVHNIDNGEKRLQNISVATHQLAELFDRWLQSDRLNYALNEAEPEPIALDIWLPEFVADIQKLHETHPIFFDECTPTELWADVRLLKTALLNLIDNAAKYSEAHQPVRITVLNNLKMIGIKVSDQGIGIAPDNLSKVFEEYFRCKDDIKTPGIGLGLAFVRQIMNLHQGKIEVTSELGHGSSFCLWFPIPGAVSQRDSVGH